MGHRPGSLEMDPIWTHSTRRLASRSASRSTWIYREVCRLSVGILFHHDMSALDLQYNTRSVDYVLHSRVMTGRTVDCHKPCVLRHTTSSHTVQPTGTGTGVALRRHPRPDTAPARQAIHGDASDSWEHCMQRMACSAALVSGPAGSSRSMHGHIDS